MTWPGLQRDCGNGKEEKDNYRHALLTSRWENKERKKNQKGNTLLQKIDEFILAQWTLECRGNEQVKIRVLWSGNSI